MNRAFYILSVLAGVGAIAVVVLVVRSFRSSAVHAAGLARVEQMLALVLLALGVITFGAGALSTGSDASGSSMLPPAVLLAVTGLLAWRQPGIAGRVMLLSAAAVVPIGFVLALAIGGAGNTAGAVVFILIYAVPAAITGWLLYRAERDASANGK
jgi:hypothetical protein